MQSDLTLGGVAAAVRTTGQCTGRAISVNATVDTVILLAERITSDQLHQLIDEFKPILYEAIKKLLKSRRGDFIANRDDLFDTEQPYYFTGYWTKGAHVKHGQRRFVFSIANTNILRSAAGLSGGGPRSPDYARFPNEEILKLPWDERLAIIDRALGPNWSTLQSAIKPSAHDFGVVLPDLAQGLTDAGDAKVFLNRLLSIAKPMNRNGEVSLCQPHFLVWCFLAYLHKRDVLLLPTCSYRVKFLSAKRSNFFDDVVFSTGQRDAIDRLWQATEQYTEFNRMLIMRIVQTVFLTADIQTLGDISRELFVIVSDAIIDAFSAAPTYREKLSNFARTAYDLLVTYWNEDSLDQKIIQQINTDFQEVPKKRHSLLAEDSRSARRRADPFWFAEVPNDEWNKRHPIPGYLPNNAVQNWAALFRETFPHIKVKDLVRFRVAGNHWLVYINSLNNAPYRIQDIIRSQHINDVLSQSGNTFRSRLAKMSLSPGVKNGVLSALMQMFDIHLRIHGIEIRNPIDFDLDRFLEPQPRGKTPRTPLSPEMLLYLKEFNRRENFAFSRSLKPKSWTSGKVTHLRHYRRVVDPEDGETKMEWWPGLAVLLDLMLTIPLRGFQARWLDTGEGDENVLDLESLQESPNPLPSAQKGRQMGVFASFAKGLDTSERLLGLRITTNKLPVECDGRFGIPWCPDDLRENIAMLLAWQRRYNPISTPVRAERDYWAPPLRNEEVTSLIPTIFPLFRDPGLDSGPFPPTYQQVQTYWNLLCSATEDELQTLHGAKFRLTRDRTRTVDGRTFSERVALFDLHTLRVSGITALIEAGLPPHFVQEIVGHAAIVMTLYYYKSRPGQINRALVDALESRELSLENIPELLADLNSYDAFLLNNRATEDAVGRKMLQSALGNGTYQVLSHGICPGGDCRTGGEYEHANKEHNAVPRAGACALCRYRVTGPMFLAGLVVNANKIMSELHAKGQDIAALNDEIRARRREGRGAMAFEARREILHRELEDLWLEWAAEHQYVQDSSHMLTEYLTHRTESRGDLPLLAAEGALAKLSIKVEHRHPFHLSQLLAEASAYMPAERYGKVIAERDAFLNELLANNNIDPFLLRLEKETRLHAGNMLGNLLAEMVPDADLQALHDGKIPIATFLGLDKAIQGLVASDSRRETTSFEVVHAPIKVLRGSAE